MEDIRFKPGDLVNTPNGPGIVAGHSASRIFVAPTGQDPPFSSKLAYCEAWKPSELILRGWRSKVQALLIQENGQSHSPRARKVKLRG